MKNNLIILTICLFISGMANAFIGCDYNWDFLNYHWYNAYAVLNNRLDIDLMPAGIQSYFNPILDIINYVLREKLDKVPDILHFISGFTYGFLIYILYLINNLIFQNYKNKNLIVFFSTLIGATDCIIVSEIGKSFHDIPIAILILISFYLLAKSLISENDTENKPKKFSYYIPLAGLIAGISCGLKFSGIVPTISLFIAFLILSFSKDIKTFIKNQVLFILFLIVGFLITDGYWLMLIYNKFGNPVFPMYNEIFKSDLFTLKNFADVRYIDPKISQFLFFPLFWHLNRHVCETPFFDLRHTAYYFSFILLSGYMIYSKIKYNSIKLQNNNIKIVVFLCTFILTAFILWMETAHIIRYIIYLLAFSGTIILLVTYQFISKYNNHIYIYIIVFLAVNLAYFAPDWSMPKVMFTPKLNIEDNSVVYLFGKPISYFATKQNKKARYIYLPSINFEYEEDSSDPFHFTDKYYELIDQYSKTADKKYVLINTSSCNDGTTDCYDENKFSKYVKDRYLSDLRNCKHIKSANFFATNILFCEVN